MPRLYINSPIKNHYILKCYYTNNESNLIVYQLTLKKIFLELLIFIIFSINALGQDFRLSGVIKDSIYKDHIKSVLLHQEYKKISYPIIHLNTRERLTLSFDDLSTTIQNYQYDFIHCNFRWEPSQISRPEYLNGFSDNRIDNYAYSFNTYFDYIHYKVSIPNELVSFKKSGNYILVVYQDFNKRNILFTKRFRIVKNQVEIEARVKRPILPNYRDTGHEIDFTVKTQTHMIDDPYNDIKVEIHQNGRQDNVINDLKPLFVSNNELRYNHQEGNIFYAGKEFRYFNTKTLRYQSEKIKSIVFDRNYFHVTLFPNQPRDYDEYFYNPDRNGFYMVDIEEEEKPETDADYVFVNFALDYPANLVDGDIYIIGNLTNWQLDSTSMMNYNLDKKRYERTLLLKQGYYNYLYAFKKKGAQKGDITLIEGSHYEAENDYLIFIYHKKPNERYVRLIGYRKINSLEYFD